MIEQYAQLVPLIYDALLGKASVALYDCEKYIEVKQGSVIKFPVQSGDTLTEGTGSYNSIHSGKKVVEEIDAHVLGIAYFSVAYPLIENGESIGGMVVAISSEMLHINDKLRDTAHNLASSLEQISAAIENIASSAQDLSTSGLNISQSSQNVYEKAEEMEEVVQYIDSVASDTKLLGLNASIEAARAGEIGRGFGVVASEIRSMAVSSAGSAKDIRKIIHGIRQLISKMTAEMAKLGANTQEVSASIEEIGASIESLTLTAEQLEEMAESL
jgi:flagellin-like hook-associated protein FlgL